MVETKMPETMKLNEAESFKDRFRFAFAAKLLAGAALSLMLLQTACGGYTNAQEIELPAVKNLVATLEDEVRDLGGNKIKWATHWKLCWDKYPEAVAYELQIVTGEGVRAKLRSQSGQCFSIKAAAGENERSQGLLNRELLLLMQSGQLGYRVRAVHEEGRTSRWSATMEVGKATPQK